ncbi:MAG: hypothetical protein VX290_04340, partial [Candidatus Latescibacterota bacterium]|nr:hypothetical protein [Candidatus Latescibacterota bacterium]
MRGIVSSDRAVGCRTGAGPGIFPTHPAPDGKLKVVGKATLCICNDIFLVNLAGLGIAFRAKPVIRREAG